MRERYVPVSAGQPSEWEEDGGGRNGRATTEAGTPELRLESSESALQVEMVMISTCGRVRWDYEVRRRIITRTTRRTTAAKNKSSDGGWREKEEQERWADQGKRARTHWSLAREMG